jgi:3-oxoacid CoA-transferase B subunit
MSTKEEIRAARARVAKRAYAEIVRSDMHLINLGFGLPMKILGEINKDPNKPEILLQGESNIIGMEGNFDEGDEEANMSRVDPAGIPSKVSPNGARTYNVADAFALINSGRLDATFLGAFEVGKNCDLANWATSYRDDEGQRAGLGGAAELVRGAKRVIICTLEKGRQGEPKIVDKITMPPTGLGVVDLVITENSVYKKIDGILEEVEVWDFETESYVEI